MYRILFNFRGFKIRRKIIIAGPAYPYRGGIANFTDSLQNELRKENDVRIFTFKRQYPSFLFPGKTQYVPEYNPHLISHTQNLQIIDSINPVNWVMTGNMIKNIAPDILIMKYWLPFFGPCLGTIAKIAKSNKKTKIAAICHNILPHEKKPGDEVFTNYFFKYVDSFILLSQNVVNDLLKFKADPRYKVLPHPVYSKFGDRVEKKTAKEYLKINDEKVILFFGLIRDYKGLDVLLEAMAILKNRLNIKLIIAGEFYSNEEKYKDLISKLDISNLVYLYNNFIPEAEVKYFFSASDAVILPYRDATQSGIVQVAMNFKKPAIAADVGGLGEVIQDCKTGFVVPKEDPEQLASAILRFYNENKEQEFVSNIEYETGKYSWGNFVKGIFELE